MDWIDWTLSIITVLVGITVTAVVMKQNAKSGQSAVTGNNTFYGSNKGKTLDGVLSKWTVVLSLLFIVLCVCTTISIMN